MVFFFIQLAISLLSVAVLIAAMRMWQTPRARYFIFYCLAIFLYAVGYLLVLANAYPDSTLYFESLAFVNDPSPHLLIGRGPFFYVEILYSYGLIFFAGVEIVRFFPRRNAAEKRQVVMFLLAAILPFLAVLLLVADNPLVSMDLGSAALAISALILLYYVVTHRLRDWLPFAREQVVEKMNDGFVLVDDDNCYIDANRVATEYFPQLEGLARALRSARYPAFPSICWRAGRSSSITPFPLAGRSGCCGSRPLILPPEQAKSVPV